LRGSGGKTPIRPLDVPVLGGKIEQLVNPSLERVEIGTHD
jgi:hypothetical protein